MSQINSRLQGGGLILPQGSSPGNINAGERALILDSDGTAKLQDAAGNKSSIGGGTSWFDTEAAAHVADVPALTDFVPLIVGQSALTLAVGANAADAGVEGGALKGTGASYAKLTASTVFQNPATLPWAISYQARLGTIVAAKVSYIGLASADNSRLLFFASDPSRVATNFCFFGFDGSNTTVLDLGVAADAATHTLRATSNGTTTKVYLDNVLRGTLTNGSEAHYPAVPVAPAFIASSGFTGGQAIWNCLYSFART